MIAALVLAGLLAQGTGGVRTITAEDALRDELASCDRNGDGMMSRAEANEHDLAALHGAGHAQGVGIPAEALLLGRLFQSLDADGDGLIPMADVRRYAEARTGLRLP